MKNNNKILAVLSTAAVGGLIATAVSTPVSAKMVSFVSQNATKENVRFDKDKLIKDSANKVLGLPSPMYDEFVKESLVAFEDDVNGLVDKNAVISAYQATKIDTTKTFDLDSFISTSTAKVTGTVNSTCDENGNVKPVTPTPTTLSVSSVSAITKTKVQVTFNTAVDAATKDNFSIAGVTITGATLSADRTKVDLDITGANWSTAYTVKATGLKVVGTAQPDLTGTFTSLSVNDAYSLSLTSDDATVIADAGHTTTLRAKLIDKATGASAANVDGMVIQFTTSAGNLANSRVTVQNGEADVTFISETKTSDVTAKVDAQINEASNDYKALIGKVFGTTNITLTASGPDMLTKAILTGAQSDIADRVTLHFNKTVSVKNFVQQNLDGTFVVDDAGNAVTTGCPYQVVIAQPNGNKPLVRGFQPVAGDDKSMVVILRKTTALTDNTEVDVNFVDTANVVNSNQSFILTDPRPAEPTSVAAQGLTGLNVVLSEPIVAPDRSQIAIDAGKIDFANKDKFNAPEGGFISTGDFDQNKFTDTRNVLSLNFGTYIGDVKAADSIDGKDHKDKDQMFLTAGKHSVQLSAIEDFAGLTDSKNISTTQTLDFTVKGNDVVPAVTSVVAESPEQFRVKFNCDVTTPSKVSLYALDATGKYVVINGVKIDDTHNIGDPLTVGAAANPQGINIKKVSNSEYIVQVTEDWTLAYNTTVTNKNYYNGKYALHFDQDALTNPANGKTSGAAFDAAITGDAIATPDVTSPVINSIVAAHDKTLNAYDVVMSKPVKVGVDSTHSADTDATIAQTQLQLPVTTVQFLGKDSAGNTVTVDGTVVPYVDTPAINPTTTAEAGSAGDTIFKVVPNLDANKKSIQDLVNNGTYQQDWTVVVKSISDDVGNTAATLTRTFKFIPVNGIEDFYVNPGTSNNKFEVKLNADDKDTIKVTFTEPVSITGNVENATDVSNYTLDGNLLPKGSIITLTSDVGAPVGTTDIDAIKDNTILIKLPDGTINNSTSHTLVVAKSLKSALGTAYDTAHAVQFVLPNAVDAATKVTLGTASLGTAGDKTITGLTASTVYSVSVNGAAAIDMKTDATGALTGLDNTKIYLVTAKVVAPTKVTLGAGSLGTAGDKTITGLTASTTYSVSVGGAAAADMTTDATGALTGLDNTKTYVVTAKVVAPTKVTLGAGSLGTAGDKTITGLTASTAYSVSVGGAAATDMTTDATGALTGLDNTKTYVVTAKAVATPAVKTADAAYNVNADYSTVTVLTVDGTLVNLTNVKALNGTITPIAVNAMKTALNLDLVAAGVNGVTATEVGGKIVLTSGGSGSLATVDLSGSNVPSATALGFTNLAAVHGTN